MNVMWSLSKELTATLVGGNGTDQHLKMEKKKTEEKLIEKSVYERHSGDF